MRIERIELRTIRMELVHPFETSFGTESARHAIIVRIDGEGLTGYGECVAGLGPWYSYETVGTSLHILREYLAPRLIGQDVRSPEEVGGRFSGIRGHSMAKAGLEFAVWDLLAQIAGQPLARFLGGQRDRVDSGVSIGIQPSLDALLERIDGFLAQGYRRVKLKIKPGWDVDVVPAVRERFPDVPLMVDANSAYSLEDLDVFQRLDNLGLLMIEQPLGYDDIYEHSKLQARLQTPLCLDESIHTARDARWALEIGSCGVINIKPGRVGGLTEARRIHDLCEDRGVPVWCGGMLETGIGRAHNVALATLPNFRLPGDLSASDRYYVRDVIDPPFALNPDGTLTVPSGPGIGVSVNHELLGRFTMGVESIASKGFG